MKLYADAPARRTRQLLADVLFVLWIVGWVWIGHVVQHGTMQLAGVGRQTDASATSLAERPDQRRRHPQRHPARGRGSVGAVRPDVVGVAGPRRGGPRPGDRGAPALLGAGHLDRGDPDPVRRASSSSRSRWRFVREATAGARFIDAAEDLDLFALRALARQPMYVLAKISDDPAGAWRARDPEVVTALARLELRDAGLAVPAHLS